MARTTTDYQKLNCPRGIRLSTYLLAAIAAVGLMACGGGGSPPAASPTYSITATVSGLSGSGLILQNNGANDLSVSANGTFTINSTAGSGSAYAVTVKTQPNSPAQTCVVANGLGAVANANISNITVACTTNTYVITATVSGLSGVGLTLQNNGTDDLHVSANGTITVSSAAATGSAYAVTVKTQPSSPAQTCVITNGSGSVATVSISNIAVTCTTVPSPTVTAYLSKSKALIGDSVVLSWQSTDATTCSVAGLIGSGGATTGGVSFVAAAGGQFTYTVQCTGAGGFAKKDLLLTVPMPVYATSYENKNSIPYDGTAIKTVRSLGIARAYEGEQDSVERSVAYADFFQEGKYSAFVVASRTDGKYGDVSDVPRVSYFLRQDSAGKWIDGSDTAFKQPSDRLSCISPSYTLVADFNNDKRPDVYIACTGFDFVMTGFTQQQIVESGKSPQILFMSQADGSYARTSLLDNAPIYGHKAQAADINRDGFIDVVTTDVDNSNQLQGCGVPFVLLGAGDGTFRRDDAIVSSAALKVTHPNCGMFNVDLIPIGSRLDLFVGSTNSAIWFKGIAGGFDFSSAVSLEMPVSASYKSQYQFPLDLIYEPGNGAIYAHTATTTTLTSGTEWATLKFDGAGKLLAIVDTWFNPSNSSFSSYSAQIKPSSADVRFFVAYTAGCSNAANQGMCALKIPK